MPLPRQVLFLGRTLSESSKSDVHAGFCRPPSCSDSGRLVMASPSTEQHTTQMDQQHLHRHLTTPPAAPRRKLPQCTFQMNMSTAYGSTAATPIPGGISDPPITCYQHAHSYYLQSEAVEAQSTTTVKQHATHAASMSALMAAAKPISSAEHLLQKLQRRSTPTTITSEQESSGNHETSALTTCNLLDTGAAARLVDTSLPGCTPSSPVHSETGSFQDKKAAGVQPSPRAHATYLVDSCLAHSHGQTQQGWEVAHAGVENRGHASGTG
ncbi:hypothetical protein ABBQ32_000707 [Trebouxia sp. C0010 RCD-2024]